MPIVSYRKMSMWRPSKSGGLLDAVPCKLFELTEVQMKSQSRRHLLGRHGHVLSNFAKPSLVVRDGGSRLFGLQANIKNYLFHRGRARTRMNPTVLPWQLALQQSIIDDAFMQVRVILSFGY